MNADNRTDLDEAKFKRLNSTPIEGVKTLCWSCPHDAPTCVIFDLDNIDILPRNADRHAVPICDWCHGFYNAILAQGFCDPIGEIFKKTVRAFAKRVAVQEAKINEEDQKIIFISLYQKAWSDNAIKIILKTKSVEATDELIEACERTYIQTLLINKIDLKKITLYEAKTVLEFAVDLVIFSSKPENTTSASLERLELELSKISSKKIVEASIAYIPFNKIDSQDIPKIMTELLFKADIPRFISELFKAYSHCLRGCTI